jgi:hypothetical protein
MPGPIYVNCSSGSIAGGDLTNRGPVYHAEMQYYWATDTNGKKYVAKGIRVFRGVNGVSTAEGKLDNFCKIDFV